MQINLVNNTLSNNLIVKENLLKLTNVNYVKNTISISKLQTISNFIMLDTKININEKPSEKVNIQS